MAQRSNFIVRGGLDMSGFTKGLQQTQKQLGSFQKSISGSMKLVTAAISTIAIGSLIKDSLTAASTLESAMMGLTSIVSGQGRDIDRAKAFINDYVSDGLVPLTNAVTAYKNLVARGYSDDQIESTMNRLKDAASFGRQASYSLGEAVTSATEGLKNENSILVDNAGVTKNVSKMWEDYAKQIGKSTNDLTKQEKIQAEVNGIMAETQFQVGDAAKYTGTYQGRLSALNKTLTDIKVNLGNAFMPIANVVIPILQNLGNKLSSITSSIASFTQALFGKAMVASANNTTETTEAIEQAGNAAKEAGKKANSAIAPFDELIKIGSSNGASGSSAGGTTTSTTETTTANNDATESTNSFASAAEELKKKLEPLTIALNNLWEKIKPFSENVGDGLKWFTENVLSPMSEIVISETIPNVLYSISSAIGLINTVVDKFKENKGKDTILGFLQGLQEAKLQGVSDSFKKLGDALTALDEFIQNPNWKDLGKYIKNALSISFDISGVPDFTDPFKSFDLPSEISIPITAFVATSWEMLKDKWSELTENIRPITAKFLAVVGTTAALIKAKWQELSKQFNPKTVKFVVDVVTTALDMFKAGKALIKEFIKGILSIAMPDLSWLGKAKEEERTHSSGIGKFAVGGFPDTGSLFIANEAGPELVGRIGNQTAVANQDQITNGIAMAVSSAMSEDVALMRQQNELLRAILARTGITTKDMFKAVAEESDAYIGKTGRSRFAY